MSSGQSCYPLNRTKTSLRHFTHDIRLSGIRSVHFLKSDWENFQPENGVSLKYLLYRSFFFACMMFIIIYNTSCSRELSFYLIYLTHWSLITQIVYSFLFLIRVSVGWVKSRSANQRVSPEQDLQMIEAQNGVNDLSTRNLKLNWLEKMIWVLNSVCFVSPFIVTLGFWLFLVRGDPDSFQRSVRRDHCYLMSTSMIHGVNCILGTIDFFIIAIPVRITHALYLCSFAAVYLLFSGLYEAAGGHYPMYKNYTTCKYMNGTAIYGFLNWKESPRAAGVACVVAIFGGILFFILAYLLYAVRLYIVSFYKPEVYAEHYYGVVIIPTNDRPARPATASTAATAPSITVTKAVPSKEGGAGVGASASAGVGASASAGVTFKTLPPLPPPAPVEKNTRSGGNLKVEIESEYGDDDDDLSVSTKPSRASKNSDKKNRRKSRKPRSKGKVPK